MTEVAPLLLAAFAPVAREAAHRTMPRRLVTTHLVDATSISSLMRKILRVLSSAYETRSRPIFRMESHGERCMRGINCMASGWDCSNRLLTSDGCLTGFDWIHRVFLLGPCVVVAWLSMHFLALRQLSADRSQYARQGLVAPKSLCMGAMWALLSSLLMGYAWYVH